MIVLFTSVEKGGIFQFTVQIYEELKKKGIDVVCFVPDTSTTQFPDSYSIVKYSKFKKITNNAVLRDIVKKIESYSPDLIWFCDNGIVSNQVFLKNKNKYNQLLVIHDVINHISYNVSLKNRLKQWYQKVLTNRASYYAKNVVLLSPNSKKQFDSLYSRYSNKSILMNLGAHIPMENNVKPSEINSEDYILFFGRIDKYKGIENLLNAYSCYQGNYNLVIAGSGKLSATELGLIQNDDRVILINRYISDGEMKWLFENSACVVLPYIEATQSGIIPIAYKYGKPIVASNVPGLTQYINEEIGFVCTNSMDYVNAFKSLESPDNRKLMGNKCIEYYNENLDWQNSIETVLKIIEY